MGILKLLLYISILSLPAGMILRLQGEEGLAINFIDVVVLVTSFAGLIYLVFKKDLNFKYRKEAVLFFITCLISLIVNLQSLEGNKLLISSLYLVRLASYFLIFVLVSKQTKQIEERLINLLFFSGFILSLIGFTQLAFYPYLRNIAYLGWDVHLYRLVSSFLDPNFAGVFFGINALLLFNLVWDKYSQKRKFNKPYIILLVISLISLILTYSRGATLAFTIALIINLIILGKKKMLAPVVGFIIVVMAFFLFTSRSEGTNILRVTSTFARLQSYEEGFKIFIDHPIFGVGFNAYRFSAEKYNFADDKNNYPEHGLSGNDNSFLFVLATVGILGFSAFLLFWKKVLSDLWKNRSKVYSRSLLCVFALLFVSSFFVNALFYPMIMLYYFVLLGVQGE